MTTRVAQPGLPSASGDDGSRAAEVAEGIGAVDELIGGTDGRQLPDQRVRDRVGQGVGEAPAICVAAATANAIYNATGVRIYELPFTPENVYRALVAARAEKAAA